ncbi:MdtA/MuxA family multidrug efflux RND transporter periplasmic adaptor subunit [Jeongeupia naejangsanensis]|uniref:MdtA/MuxA family multidrug efflux RND transporter periplasmic adaptor subunit n=1 Tax=Jeongeupia naejangsanensis TaxID=613195 RepID=A0ABS2BKU5_9NEIS|nr:MdtA/MuxA family multidrug efflux RND transporter periplasmic adaptor subunit [Jeongeupia naejangsanensis]MBM3116229.1 MdtA/MuxA family multidrug efflux RND transporter periplasmic adaptor subunit [Jeongeupia naejangsanensis]
MSNAAPEARPSHRRWWIAAIIVVLAGGGWLLSREAPMQGAKPGGRGGMGMSGPQPVQAKPVLKGEMPVILSGLGTVTAANTVIVRSQVDGQLMKLHFTEGQVVKQGQLLAEIDPRPFQVALTQAEGQMAKDMALLANARADLARYQQLLKQESIAKQQVDAQVALVGQYEGAIKADQGAVDAARLNLTYSRVTAPVAGRVGLRQVDPGNLVKSGDTNGLVVITTVTPINVLFTLPEAQLSQVLAPLHQGEALQVEAWDRGMAKAIATGKLLTVDNQIDTTTGTVKLKAEFANDDGMLFPNQFVNARIKVADLKDVAIAPSAAIQHGSQGSFVWVVGADGKVKQQVVKTGPTQGERIVILEGAAPGDKVVTDGADRLRDGAAVEVVDPNKRNASGTASRPQGRRHHKAEQ